MLNAQCPMPHAPCPMPNAQCPMPHAPCPMPNAPCPMPNAQCPMPKFIFDPTPAPHPLQLYLQSSALTLLLASSRKLPFAVC